MLHIVKNGDVKLNSIPQDGFVFIYRLIKEERVIYVGQTKNLKSRIAQHACQKKEFTSIEFYPCSRRMANITERDEILRFLPELNIDLPKTCEYVTIKQAVKTISKNISLHSSMYLNKIYEGTEDKKSNRIYVSVHEINKHTEIVNNLINKLYEKECK